MLLLRGATAARSRATAQARHAKQKLTAHPYCLTLPDLCRRLHLLFSLYCPSPVSPSSLPLSPLSTACLHPSPLLPPTACLPSPPLPLSPLSLSLLSLLPVSTLPRSFPLLPVSRLSLPSLLSPCCSSPVSPSPSLSSLCRLSPPFPTPSPKKFNYIKVWIPLK